MKTAKKAASGHAASVRVVAGGPVAGSIVEYAHKVAASKQRSQEAARKAGIVTKSGKLTAHYK
jgi:hypothetical protein